MAHGSWLVAHGSWLNAHREPHTPPHLHGQQPQGAAVDARLRVLEGLQGGVRLAAVGGARVVDDAAAERAGGREPEEATSGMVNGTSILCER